MISTGVIKSDLYRSDQYRGDQYRSIIKVHSAESLKQDFRSRYETLIEESMQNVHSEPEISVKK